MHLAVLDTSPAPGDPYRVARWLRAALPRGWRVQADPTRWQVDRDGWPLGLAVPGSGSPGEIEQVMQDFAWACREADLEHLALGPQVLMGADDDSGSRPGPGGQREDDHASSGPFIAALVVAGAGLAAFATGALSLETLTTAGAALVERVSAAISSLGS